MAGLEKVLLQDMALLSARPINTSVPPILSAHPTSTSTSYLTVVSNNFNEIILVTIYAAISTLW